MSLTALLWLLSAAPAHADCPAPGILWVVPDSATRQYGTNVHVHVAVTDTAPGAEVYGTIRNDDTGDLHTLTWEVQMRDTGLAAGAADADTTVHDSLHIGTPDPELLPDSHYTFEFDLTLADGSAGGTGTQAIWTSDGPDAVGPAVNGRFTVEVAPVAESCAFGVPELLFTFRADDLHADGGDADSLQSTLFLVTVREGDEGTVLYDTGYYTGTTWSAVAARFESRPDLCFDIGATDLYANRTNYANDYCVPMPGYETPDAGPDGGSPGDFHVSNGCFCGAAPGAGSPPALGVFAALAFALFLTRRASKAK